MQPNGINPNGINPNGTNPNGMFPNGMHPNAMYPNGMNPNGMHPDGTHSNGIRQNGLQQNGMSSTGQGMLVPQYPLVPMDNYSYQYVPRGQPTYANATQSHQPFAPESVVQLPQAYYVLPMEQGIIPYPNNGQQASRYYVPPQQMYMWQLPYEDIPMPPQAESYYQPPQQQSAPPRSTVLYRADMYNSSRYVQAPRMPPVMFPTVDAAEARNEIMFNRGMMPKRVSEFYDHPSPSFYSNEAQPSLYSAYPNVNQAVDAEIKPVAEPTLADIYSYEELRQLLKLYEQFEEELEMEAGVQALERQMDAEFFNSTQ